MTDKKTDEEVLDKFIADMVKLGWQETSKEDQVIGIKKHGKDTGYDKIYIDVEADIYTYVRSTFAREFSCIDLTSQELKLLGEYKCFIEGLQVEILQQRERIAQYKKERL
jgi:hypothetical protein